MASDKDEDLDQRVTWLRWRDIEGMDSNMALQSDAVSMGEGSRGLYMSSRV